MVVGKELKKGDNNMKDMRFSAQVLCSTGWADEEEIGELEVSTFSELLDVVKVINNGDRNGEIYTEIASRVLVPSGDEVNLLHSVEGIVGRMNSGDGVVASVGLSDNRGVTSSCRVDSEKYGTEQVDRIREAKRLATQIMRL